MLGDIGQNAQFFQESTRQGIGFVDQEQHLPGGAIVRSQVAVERNPQLAFVHAAEGDFQLKENHLEQRPAGAELGAGQRDDYSLAAKLLGEHFEQQSFAGAGGTENQDSIGTHLVLFNILGLLKDSSQINIGIISDQS